MSSDPETGSLRFNPLLVDFGDVESGGRSQAQAITIRNDSSTATPTLEVVANEPFAIEDNGCARSLPPAASCVVLVVFVPSFVGSQSGLLQVKAGGVGHSVGLKGRGVPREVGLSFEPTALDFGRVEVGQSSRLTMKAVNVSGRAVEGLMVVVANSAAFTVSPPPGRCPAPLAPGATCELEVEFAPREAAPHVATLIAYAGGGSVTAALSGTGVLGMGHLTATPDRLDFGAVPLPLRGGPLRVRIENDGDRDVGMIGASLEGTSAATFSITSGCLFGLPPGGACAFDVTFKPTTAGDVKAVLLVSGSPGATASILLVGKGVNGEALLTLEPASLDFGAVGPVETTGYAMLAVRNASAFQAGRIRLELLGPDKGDFVVVSDSCSGVALPPSGTCDVGMRFTPMSLGPKSASLTVAGMPGGTVAAPLTGLSLPADDSIALRDDAGNVVRELDFSALPPDAAVGETRKGHGTPVGRSSPALTLHLTNRSMFAIAGVAVDIAGKHPRDFEAALDGCLQGPGPGLSCDLVLTFRPTDAGEREATLSVSLAGGRILRLTLRGWAL